MGRVVKSNDIVLLFEQYSQDSQNLLQSFHQAGYRYPSVVIEDDGFLPENVVSVYGFFLGRFKGKKGIPGKPRYFNQIIVPDYWEITGTNSMGKVQDLYKERGRIFYAEPKHKRLVKVVDWYDEKGTVRSSDHYNRYGALYARTIFNTEGKKVNKSYFSAEGKEIIVENFVTNDIILNEGTKVKIFPTKTDFILYFLEEAGYGESKLYFNSLSYPFFVSRRLPNGRKGDILFWQEQVWDEIPGNMRLILNEDGGRTVAIMVQKKKSYDRLLELGASPDMVHKLGFIYPFKKRNRHKPEALVCTNSDNIEHCREIIEALPEIHFHIAALTEMSSKLMRMGEYENVSLYPGVKMDILDMLFEVCDFYLDINHESEIVSAVYRAFLYNHLIFAFKETLHNGDYVAEDNIYPISGAEKMIADIKASAGNTATLNKRLKKQQEAALSESRERYRSLLNED